MTAQARRIDETRLRRALSRVLAPALVKRVVEEAVAEDDAMAKPRATPEQVERARAWARQEAKR